MRLPATSLLLLSLICSAPTLAAPTSSTSASVTSQKTGAVVGVDLRSEYIAGDKVLVQVSISNPGSAPITVPDLSARPWLVTFRLVTPTGSKQERRSKPPEADGGKTVTIGPRGTRNTLLEIPSGGALDPGAYELGLTIDLAGEVLEVEKRPAALVAPKPVSGQLDARSSVTQTDELHAVWVHQATSGYQVYLHQASGSQAGQTLADWYLLDLDQPHAVQLAAARPSQAWDRHLVWTTSDRGIAYARLGANGVRTEAVQVDAPWPRIELIGRPATDGTGGLHAPIWVPSPKGDRGEFRILSIGERGTPAFQRAGMMSTRPRDVDTAVSDDGTAMLMVASTSGLDIYPLSEAPKPDAPALPVASRRISKADAAKELLMARFAVLPESESFAGGLAILALFKTEAGIVPTWLNLRGSVIQELPATPVDGEVLALLPRGTSAPGLMVRKANGSSAYQEGAKSKSVGTLPESWSLVTDSKGAPLLRTLGAPVKDTPLNL